MRLYLGVSKPRTLTVVNPSALYLHAGPSCTVRDINPVAPTHILIVPKRRDGLTQLRFATSEHAGVLGYMLQVAALLATSEELVGFRYGCAYRCRARVCCASSSYLDLE